jgi:hypothetical protein
MTADQYGVPHELTAQITLRQAALADRLTGSLRTAVELGALLSEAKAQCRHGNWGTWLEAGSGRMAQRYMALARNERIFDE